MDVWRVNEEKEMARQQYYNNIDYQSLQKYNLNNEHFVLTNILSNQDEEQKQALAFYWIYRYENHFIELEQDLSNGIWKIIPGESNREEEEEEQLNILLDDFHNSRNLSLDQQIQLIIKRFDHHFSEINKEEIFQENHNKIGIASILKEDDEIKYLNNRADNLSLNNLLRTSTVSEDDEQLSDTALHSLRVDSHRKLDSLSPIVKSNRIRQDSSCSTTSSVKYTSFIPPLQLSVHRRRVIQSILLHVQPKKKTFEKVIEKLTHQSPRPTMYQLGLEFLRIYDGKFNYQPGHTFVLSFEKKSWFLTIDHIKCIQCQLGQPEPRSVLVLNYKNHFTIVQV